MPTDEALLADDHRGVELSRGMNPGVPIDLRAGGSLDAWQARPQVTAGSCLAIGSVIAACIGQQRILASFIPGNRRTPRSVAVELPAGGQVVGALDSRHRRVAVSGEATVEVEHLVCGQVNATAVFDQRLHSKVCTVEVGVTNTDTPLASVGQSAADGKLLERAGDSNMADTKSGQLLDDMHDHRLGAYRQHRSMR